MAHDTHALKMYRFLQRLEVPARFPQFRNSGALAHLAHMGRGPRYVLVGGRAWYDPADICVWLEENKRSGPSGKAQLSTHPPEQTTVGASSKKRGRPTKFEQMQ